MSSLVCSRWRVARNVWPTLATAVAAVCVAYLAFLVSGVRGLAQLATFNIVGLAAAGLCTPLPAALGCYRSARVTTAPGGSPRCSRRWLRGCRAFPGWHR
ncbi:MAG: hypothetical protein WDM77_17130 [Steroidobacteraceae bacterium]